MNSLQSRLTVDLDAVTANWRVLAQRAPRAECAGVVKADAYCLGVDRVAPALLAAGVRTFFVATAEEGLRLRQILGDGPVLYVMNGAGQGALAELVRQDVRPVLSTGGQCRDAIEFAKAHGRLYCGVQVDSGMNRLGLEEAEAVWLEEEPGVADVLDVRLLMSHLGSADEEGHPANERQAERFDAALARLAPVFPEARHSLAATAGVLLGSRFHYDLVRPGIGLYGGLPFREALPVVTLEVPIVQIRSVAAGETLGYGRDWRANRDSRVATIPVGYADGILRCLGGKGGRGTARVAGRTVPFAGRVNMDLVTLDVTGIPGVEVGAMVELLGPGRGIDAAAEEAGTIGHEILTSLRGKRLERRYEGEGAAP